MASTLTSTSVKSTSFYFLFLSLLVFGVFYLIKYKDSNSTRQLVEQAFRLNASAFDNAIHLAHSKFLINNNKNSYLDLWVIDSIGLDYNRNGFPIGVNIKNPRQNTPTLREHCIEIWGFILSPLHPPVQLVPSEDNYWVDLNDNHVCVFRRSNLPKMSISYHSDSGKVILVK